MLNIVPLTDSYKWGHWSQYPSGTDGVYSYLEARQGAKYPETVFFGLQSILREIAGTVVTRADVEEAREIAKAHFFDDKIFNYNGWMHIVNAHGGRLPLRIKAVPEGTVVPAGNVLMTVENTDPACYWLTNALESKLLHVWYPTTVASLSRYVKGVLKYYLQESADTLNALPYMLHDFGYRSATNDRQAAVGGAAHLVNFVGTDTIPALYFAAHEYGAAYKRLGFSVPATEHSVMTSLGRAGEQAIVKRLLENHPTGILSVVADSYNIYNFVDMLGLAFHDEIMARDGKFVVRPDSVTLGDTTPEALVLTLLNRLQRYFGSTVNSKGYSVLNPHVGLIWGDGIDPDGIQRILEWMLASGWSAENIVFGMGGGLIQKVNRDTQRFAFKSSAQKRNGVWIPISKDPLDSTKKSKAGRLMLLRGNDNDYYTQPEIENCPSDILQTVFLNGEVTSLTTFDEIRARAA